MATGSFVGFLRFCYLEGLQKQKQTHQADVEVYDMRPFNCASHNVDPTDLLRRLATSIDPWVLKTCGSFSLDKGF